MKRFILSASLILLGAAAISPAALANPASTGSVATKQVSTAREISENATFHDLIRFNRDSRGKN